MLISSKLIFKNTDHLIVIFRKSQNEYPVLIHHYVVKKYLYFVVAFKIIRFWFSINQFHNIKKNDMLDQLDIFLNKLILSFSNYLLN